MSADEEMAIIGRMYTEKGQLAKREVVIGEEVDRIANTLEQLGRRLLHARARYAVDELDLSTEEAQALDSGKLSQLLQELSSVRKRSIELNKKLEQL